MSGWTDQMVEDHYRSRFIESDGYDPLDPDVTYDDLKVLDTDMGVLDEDEEIELEV